MINRKMKAYQLYERAQGFDKKGRRKAEEWKLKETIQVSVTLKNLEIEKNFKDGESGSGEVQFKKVGHFGLSKYKAFSQGVDYKIVRESQSYEVISVNTETRLTQLHLKEVICYE